MKKACIFEIFIVTLQPITNILNRFGDLWVFGKDVKGQEVYIKICYGQPNRSTICVSFHIAEYPMNYPYKKGE